MLPDQMHLQQFVVLEVLVDLIRIVREEQVVMEVKMVRVQEQVVMVLV